MKDIHWLKVVDKVVDKVGYRCDCKGCQNMAVMRTFIPRYFNRNNTSQIEYEYIEVRGTDVRIKETNLCEKHAKRIAHLMELLDFEG